MGTETKQELTVEIDGRIENDVEKTWELE